MDIQEFVDRGVKLQRDAAFKASPQITLGEFLKLLRAIDDEDKDKNVEFDFEYIVPTGFDSWRGSYAEIALGFAMDEPAPLLSDLIKEVKSAIGITMQGYKGGNFTMTENTPVWVANYSNSGNTGIVGVKDTGYSVVILTAYCEY